MAHRCEAFEHRLRYVAVRSSAWPIASPTRTPFVLGIAALLDTAIIRPLPDVRFGHA
jgi:hypothetical protein